MSISQLAPRDEAELALLEEMQKEGKPIKTGELVARAIKHFPRLTPAELQRRTPSGTLFWPGRFRFDLNSLKRKGQAANPVKGYWEITSSGIQRLTGGRLRSSRPQPKVNGTIKKATDLIIETAKAIKKDEVQATIIIGNNEMTIRLGKDIKQTTIEMVK